MKTIVAAIALSMTTAVFAGQFGNGDCVSPKVKTLPDHSIELAAPIVLYGDAAGKKIYKVSEEIVPYIVIEAKGKMIEVMRASTRYEPISPTMWVKSNLFILQGPLNCD